MFIYIYILHIWVGSVSRNRPAVATCGGGASKAQLSHTPSQHWPSATGITMRYVSMRVCT